jgi:hypothetical protein
MRNPDEWCREVDEDLFGEQPAVSRRRLVDEVADFPPPDAQPRRAVPIAAVDTALFGGNGPSASTATKAHDPVVVPDIVDPGEVDFAPPEPDMLTAPAVVQVIFDEDDPDSVDPDSSSDEQGAPPAQGSERRRRGVWAVGVFVALAVIGGAGLGAMALTRSGGPRPAVDTGSEGTTTTTPLTTAATTTPAAPETAAPADSSPVPTSAPRRAPTTTLRLPRVPAPAPTEPPPPAPPPPPPPPEPPPPPTSAPPPSSNPIPLL